jgi:hypothetical protein
MHLRLANAIKPGSVKKIHDSKLPFKQLVCAHAWTPLPLSCTHHQMCFTLSYVCSCVVCVVWCGQDNITSFLQAAKAFGVPNLDCFYTNDLFEGKNIGQARTHAPLVTHTTPCPYIYLHFSITCALPTQLIAAVATAPRVKFSVGLSIPFSLDLCPRFLLHPLPSPRTRTHVHIPILAGCVHHLLAWTMGAAHGSRV